MRARTSAFAASVVCIFFLHLAHAYLPPGWSWVTPLPQGNDLYAIATDGNQYVAVGDVGTVMTSPDGSTWAIRRSGNLAKLTGIAHGGGQFVAVGVDPTNAYVDTIITSPDGINWTTRVNSGYSGPIAVAYGNNRFVAAGYSGGAYATLMTSSDGITWVPNVLATNGQLTGIVWNGAKFVAVGYNANVLPNPGIVVTSPDGLTWTPQTSGVNAQLNAVTFGNGLFVAVGTNFSALPFEVIITSPDGVTWSPHPGSASIFLDGAGYVNGTYFAAGYGPGLGKDVLTSPDAVTWTAQTSGSTAQLNAVSGIGAQAVLIGQGGMIIRSPSAGSFSVVTQTAAAPEQLNAVIYDTSVNEFLAVGNVGAYQSSADGVAWNVQTSSVTTSNLNAILTIDQAQSAVSRFIPATSEDVQIVVGDSGATLVDTAGSEPDTSASCLGSADWHGSCASPTLLVEVGSGGAICHAPVSDPTNWTPATTNPDSGTDLWSCGYSMYSDQFIAVGDNGEILVSADGDTWSTRISQTSNDLRSLYAFSGENNAQGSVEAAGIGVYLGSTDGGNSWSNLSTPLTLLDPYFRIDFVIVAHGKIQLFGFSEFDRSVVYVSTDGGLTFYQNVKAPPGHNGDKAITAPTLLSAVPADALVSANTRPLGVAVSADGATEVVVGGMGTTGFPAQVGSILRYNDHIFIDGFGG